MMNGEHGQGNGGSFNKLQDHESEVVYNSSHMNGDPSSAQNQKQISM
eukprot:CAMPEP_0185568486 /NCGR_PEP_ID=MMETSP0434-20130131/1435_1 /TAXON_ID=626734 ORGANISM="Favella taraikaensis, Strain Fe Narragansett Bay" /NCGR_SAMPLE_ID=MMETSP0434 /ASSEMBLY_ACC=CAM_ASM_000379 /LENGTH=46 /DNA_ID= /DNA_START= /DNA_END= /DNA_ORIENTATION=